MTYRETFGFMINDIARMTRTAFERRIAAADLGVTTAEARTLIYIAAMGETRQNKIAERMNVEPMTTSKIVDRLEERGLAQRRQDPTDRRAKLVTATADAERLIDDIQLQTANVRDDVMRNLSRDERDAMMKALTVVRTNLQEMMCRVETEAVA